VTNGTVDFGAATCDDDGMLAQSRVKLLHIPTVLGAVVPVYNVPGAGPDLKFAPDVLADIYLGKIGKLERCADCEDNPGVKLPNQEIYVVHRSDGSGNDVYLCDYLSKVSRSGRAAWARTPQCMAEGHWR